MLTLWDASGQEVVKRNGRAGEIGGLVFSPNGKLVATAHWQNAAKVWDAASGEERLTLSTNLAWKEAPLLGIAFQPGQQTAGDSEPRPNRKDLHLLLSAQLVNLSGHTGPLLGIAFSHDGRHLATASEDGTAKVWDAASGLELLTLAGNSSPVKSVAFSRDDKRLIAERGDGTLQVYALNIDELKALARTG